MAEPAEIESQSTDSTPPSQSVNTTIDDQGRKLDADFADEDGNIILKSSDDIHYRLASYTLRRTSGFFRQMMTLPKDNRTNSANEDHNEVIPLSEPSLVLSRLFRLMECAEYAEWSDLDLWADVVAAAEKYDMLGPLSYLQLATRSPPLSDKPLQLFAVAARYDWEDVIKALSKDTLALSIYDDVHRAVLDRIPSAYLIKLVRLHRDRRVAFKNRIIGDSVYFGFTSCTCGFAWSLAVASLAKAMVDHIDQCPAGTHLRDGSWRKWPISKQKVCNHSGCRQTAATHTSIESAVQTALDSLPCTI